MRITMSNATNKQRQSPAPESIEVNAYNVGVGHSWTFEDAAVKDWTESRLEGKVLNACCGGTKLSYNGEIVRNDLNEELDADYHLKVRDLPDELGESQFDTIVYDPPWSVFQSNEEYDGRMVGSDRVMAEALDRLLTDEGHVLGFGYQSTIMPADLNFMCKEIAVFRIVGRIKCFFGVRDERVNRSLDSWTDQPSK